MSRIGKKPVLVPSGVEVKISGQHVTVKGPKSKKPLEFTVPAPIKVSQDGNKVVVVRPDDEKKNKALHGLSRALINNMVVGVSTGFSRKMEIFGVGFGCDVQGRTFVMNIGFNAPVKMAIPEGVDIQIDQKNARGNDESAKFTLIGPDKHILGQFAANVRRVRPPEPYKGKGIRYADEHVRRKEGKPLVSGG
ncbi:MAG: 50S ribosomal protein L6 [Planctomycetota bacterium]